MAKKRREIQLENKRSSKSNSKTKNKIKIISIIALVLIAIGSYIYYTQLVIPTRESKRPLSILLVGSDMSEFREDYFMGTKPEKTDSLIALTFNPETYTVDMTSIPRDTSVDYVCESIQGFDGTPYTGEQYQDQINELYQVSGKSIDCLKDTVSNFLNIPIDYYVKVNMDQLSNTIDEIGGIDIKVYAPDYYLAQENASLDQTYYWTNEEKVNMDGDQALTYARARHDSERDYGRGIRQQQVIQAITSKILSKGVDMSLIDDLLSIVDTDMPVKLVYEYYKYVAALNDVSLMFSGKNPVDINAVPDTVWLNLYDLTGYDGKLIGTEKQRTKEIEKFIKYVQSDDVDIAKLKDNMMKNHQFYNSSYGGHYNVDKDQLYEISNALRENLKLEKDDVEVPSNKYGDNYAYGLLPKESSKGRQ